MSIINKLVIDCGGSVTQFMINLPVDDEAGINEKLATIPTTLGLYTYSLATVGASTSISLSIRDLGECTATLYRDSVGYTYQGNCCIGINSSAIISGDSQNLISTGSDGLLFSDKIFFVNIGELGNNDVVVHNRGGAARIICFYNDDDNGRQRHDFYATNNNSNSFTLRNDFTDNKFTGTLLCVKY